MIRETSHPKMKSRQEPDSYPSRQPNSDVDGDSRTNLTHEARTDPKPRSGTTPKYVLEVAQAREEPGMTGPTDQRSRTELKSASQRWKALLARTTPAETLKGLYWQLRQDPSRQLTGEELAYCVPTGPLLDASNPYAMSVAMQLGSAVAGGTTAYLTSFGWAELMTGLARAGGNVVPAWGHGVMAGGLHSVMAEVFGAAMRGNRGLPASPANKAFDASLKAFCDGIESSLAHGQAIDFAPLQELVTRHLWIHLASDELAFSAFGVSGAAAAYLNGTQLPGVLPPELQKAAFEMTAALIRIVLGAFVGGVGTASLQHLLRPVIQGVTPPAPGKVHRPELLDYLEWKHDTTLQQRLVVLELADINLAGLIRAVRDRYQGQDLTRTPAIAADVQELTRLVGEQIKVADARFQLRQKIQHGQQALTQERAHLGGTHEPMTAADTFRADMNSVRTQLASKKADWPAVRSTMALCVSNAAAAALGFLIPIAATAGAATSMANSTSVHDHYMQPLDDFTASGLMPVTMIASWMLMRKPIKVAVETGMSVMAGLVRKGYGACFGASDATPPGNAATPVQDIPPREDDQPVAGYDIV